MNIEELDKPLDAANVSKRQGPGGKALSYVSGFYAIATANRVFGYDGWSYSVQSFREVGKGFVAHVRVEVKTADGVVVREDVGWGQDDPEKAIKEAVTDALKRALRSFGDQFGNSLYDKDAPAPVRAPKPAEATCPIHNVQMQRSKTGKVGHMVDGVACFGEAAA